MKLKFLIQLILVAGCTPVYAQWHNDTIVVNSGGLVSDWSVQTWNAANGNYSTVGSAGGPGSYGVFEHYGQSGNNNNSAFRNDGIYNAAVNGRDYFKGPGNNPGQQSIGGSVAPVFGELFLENGTGQPFDISNANGADIAGSASFANGVTTTVRGTASTGALRFRDNAIYINTAAGDAQYVNGYVTKSGDDAFTFPVGAQDGTDLRTLQISAPTSINNTLSVAYWNGSADSGLDPTTVGTQSLSSLNPSGITGIDKLATVSPICFWDWVATSGTSPLTVTVSIPSFSGNGGYASAADMRLAGWNLHTLQWDNLSGSNGATGNLEGSTITGNIIDMSNYGAIAIGNVLSFPLAVDILSFSGHMDSECSAHLHWTTAAETDIQAFAVRYSPNGKDYKDIAGMDVSNFTAPNDYNYTMPEVPAGKAIFGIKTLYKDGNAVYYQKELYLNSSCKLQDYLKITPNPTQNNIMISGFKGKSDVSLFDIMGRRLYNVQTEESALQINMENYPCGIYMVNVRDDNFGTKCEKIIKQ
ncbi:T9SS type A sorting domain-containing protein [Taibaiella lutea]|nr:T9SS type A sorting domain-containing protein [Taibaiella lutea]